MKINYKTLAHITQMSYLYFIKQSQILNIMKATLTVKTAKSETVVENVDFMFDILSGEMDIKGRTIVFEYNQELADYVKENRNAVVTIENKMVNGLLVRSCYNTTVIIANLLK